MNVYLASAGNQRVTASSCRASEFWLDSTLASPSCTRIHFDALPSTANCVENGVPERT
jgi:hypothetical protein